MSDKLRKFIGTNKQICNSLQYLAKRRSTRLTDKLVCEEAAARIEELEAQLGDLGAIKEKAHRQGYEQGKAAGDAFGAAIREHVERLEAERDALQARLDEAVRVLQICCNFMEYGTWPDGDPVVLAQKTIAKLKGQDQ